MQVVHTIAEVRSGVQSARRAGASIALVPTMGALHTGHLALVEQARTVSPFVVVSIFVNPTQFGPQEDLAKYPRTLPQDIEQCTAVGASMVFAPEAQEMYPQGFVTTVEVSELDRHLCGPSRPGHFRGVCTVVLKLLNIVQPDVAIFGEKDAQQARIIRRMVRDLDVPTEILFGPTVREADGLALSSRNRYLTATERALAPRIYATLCAVRDAVHAGERDVARLEALFRSMLAEIPGSRVDYASIVDEETLQPIALLDRPALAATAVFLGSTRLIDNIVITMPPE